VACLGVEQVEPEAEPPRVRKRRAIRPDRRLRESIAGERWRGRELDPSVDRMGDPERKPSAAGCQRAGNDAVSDIERLVRPPAVERRYRGQAVT
jgi:hypothetical protein